MPFSQPAATYEKTFAAMVSFLGKPDITAAEKDEKMKAFDNQLRDAGRAVEKENASKPKTAISNA